MEHCFLCGISLPACKNRRYKPTQELQRFVQASCQATPMAFAYITNHVDFPRESPVCIPCVNWKRRTEARKGKTLLQVDQLISYILQPGRMGELDQRCLPRLVEALSDKGSPFAPSVPLPVQSILARAESGDSLSLALAWWEFNGRSQFFRHTQTAKIIRGFLKGDPGESGDA